ncbi:hypothetical protein BRADI_1g64546v3 [Brachypodium distachyon]|uniref:Uncharacterized protein n=1 Tax=Brachypodium distachyon TaxID=15368 RepID=A0A2K2DTD5_BRADI|nr:hypothetical protein BRADI_1g64546v3 [Brachypodium distachyon]
MPPPVPASRIASTAMVPCASRSVVVVADPAFSTVVSPGSPSRPASNAGSTTSAPMVGPSAATSGVETDKLTNLDVPDVTTPDA